jgi:hypothetical protein
MMVDVNVKVIRQIYHVHAYENFDDGFAKKGVKDKSNLFPLKVLLSRKMLEWLEI